MFLFKVFLKSIRRRLVTGFLVAFGILLLMAAAAVWGLMRHQEAVSRLEYLVHRSPNRARLESAVTDIMRPFHNIDVSQDAAVSVLKFQLLEKVRAASEEQQEFHRRSESAARDPEFQALGLTHRTQRLTVSMHTVNAELHRIAGLVQSLDFGTTGDVASRRYEKDEIERQVVKSIATIHNTLNRLPEHEEQTNVLASLRTEKKVSARILKNVGILIVIALLAYSLNLVFGFWWISNPLRTVAHGASRIANGDTGYRLDQVLRWRDEFYDLTENFNRMADRFQESEDHLNAKVEERSRQLVRSERLAGVGFLAAGVAHEINNPLQAMSMAAESIQFRLYDYLDPEHKDTKEVMERLSMIQRESKRCGQITRRLLDFARSERQEKQRDDLTRVIGEVLAMIKPMSKYQDRQLIFERTEPLMLEINASQMKQVVLNLVSNALQATESGGIVEIRLEEHCDWVVMIVRDNGQGMNAENIENLFEPFYTTKETGIGTGLGLSITHRIVEDHHGTIDPQSDGPGKGSTFLVRLPRQQPGRRAA